MTVSLILLGVLLTIALVLIRRHFFGFMAQKPSDYKDVGTAFDIREALNGDIQCEGVVYGPLGRVNTRFVALMHAKWDGNVGSMTEEFTYDTGETLSREWQLTVTDDTHFSATAADIIGTGVGVQMGSGVQLKYTLVLAEDAGGHALNVTDWMYMMGNDTIMNRSQMYKYGVKVAELVATMRKV
jgi:hypothetical protein